MGTIRALLALSAGLTLALPAQADEDALAEWIDAANAAQAAQRAELEARGDAGSLLSAMLLVVPVVADRQRDDQGRDLAKRADALFRAAAEADADHPVVAWMLATCMRPGAGVDCGTPEARARVQAVAGDRVQTRLWLVGDALQRGDADEAQAHWTAAAAADRYRGLEHDYTELVWSTLLGLDLPEPSPEVARAYAQALESSASAPLDFARQVTAIGLITAAPSPGLSVPHGQCGLRALDSPPPRGALGEQCRHVFSAMYEQGSTHMEQIVGATAMLRLGVAGEERAHWVEAVKQLEWIREQSRDLWQDFGERFDPRYGELWREHGEAAALRWLLLRSGRPDHPPPGWEPSDPRVRALVQ